MWKRRREGIYFYSKHEIIFKILLLEYRSYKKLEKLIERERNTYNYR